MGKTIKLSNGRVAAAILSAGIGSTTLGVFTVLAQTFSYWKNILNLWDPAGPLSGKTTGAVIVWLAAWIVLHILWRDKDVSFSRVFIIAMVFIVLGFIGTFPPFFEAFGH